MQNGIAFIQPAGLRIDQILQGAPGNGAEAILDEVGADLAHRAGLIGINQCIRRH